MRESTDPVSYFRRVEAEPFQHDFYLAMRRIECLHPGKPRLGTALRPADEPVRLGQEPSMDFAPAALSSLKWVGSNQRPLINVRFFGLFGPNGPMPLHLSDYARERVMHYGDPTLARFADIFHHRLLLLFYRAWAQAQPTVSLDRPKEDRFSQFVGSLFGLGVGQMRNRDEAPDHAKLYYSGLLVRQARNADGLQSLLAGFFRVPMTVEPFVGHWMRLPDSQRTRLGTLMGGRLGVDTVVGAKIWDRQHKFRVHVGPLTLAQYKAFLPGGSALPILRDFVRQYFGFELDWDVRLVLKRDQVPRARLGRSEQLGWTTWGGAHPAARDADELILDPERALARAKANQSEVQHHTAAAKAAGVF